MNLISRVILIIMVVFICAIGIMYGVSRFIFMRGLEDIEERSTRQNIEQAAGVLSYLITDLEYTTADWAVWDDTYNFIDDRNEDYIDSNMVDDTFITLRLSTIIFFDLSGTIVFAKAFDFKNNRETDVSDELLTYFEKDSPLLARPGYGATISGIIEIEGTPKLIATQPILMSDNEGPARGTLVFCRLLDDDLIDELSGIVDFPFSVFPAGSDLPADVRKAITALEGGRAAFVSPLSDELVAGYTLLNDIYEEPRFVLKVEVPRDTFNLGQTVSNYYILAMVGVGIIIAFLSWFLIQKNILSRVRLLINGVNRIARTGDTSTRIALTGRDEISMVAGTIDGMLGALEEVSRNIRDSERRYRLLADNVLDVIWSTDHNLIITYMSPSIIQLTGFRPLELIGTSLIDLLDESERTEVSEMMEQQVAVSNPDTGNQIFAGPFEVKLRRKDGSTIITEVRPSVIRNEQGIVTGFVGVTRDIAERKQSQDELHKLYAEERNLRQSLEEEIQKRVEFTRALVHELKTPITPILAAVELLLDEIDNERLMRLVQSINRSTENLNQRIDELLDLARGEMDMLIIEAAPMDTLSFFNEISFEMVPVALRSQLTLDFDLPETLPLINADRGRLKQVVTNLINNAIKFTPEDGTITLKAHTDENHLFVEVRDTGPGINEDDLERIFEPYFRRTSDRERLSGLGLGLALSRFFVELHGGKIWAESEPGKGSIFRFTIPIQHDSIEG